MIDGKFNAYSTYLRIFLDLSDFTLINNVLRFEVWTLHHNLIYKKKLETTIFLRSAPHRTPVNNNKFFYIYHIFIHFITVKTPSWLYRLSRTIQSAVTIFWHPQNLLSCFLISFKWIFKSAGAFRANIWTEKDDDLILT